MTISKPFKILHVIKQINSGGGSLGLLNQCVLSRRYVKHYVYSILPPHDEAVIDEFTSAGVESVSADELKNVYENVDIIQVEWWNNPEINNYILNTTFPESRLILYIRVQCNAPLMCPSIDLLRKIDFCIANASLSKQKLLLSNMDLIGLPTPKIVFSGANTPEHSFHQHGVRQNANKPVSFGYVGTVDSIKIYPEFLDLVEEILKHVPGAFFRFAGEGLLDKYRSECEERGISKSIKFLGHIENISHFLAETDIFFYPLNKYTYAASEKSLQEAMLSGLPVVAFLHGGIVDLVDHNHIAVSMKKETLVTDSIELARSPTLRKQLGLANQKRMECLSLRNSILEDLLDAYESVTKIVPSCKDSLDIDSTKILEFAIDHSEFAIQKNSKDAGYLIKFIQGLYSHRTEP